MRATAAVRSTDPARVESALKDLGGQRGWLAPLVYAAGTLVAGEENGTVYAFRVGPPKRR